MIYIILAIILIILIVLIANLKIVPLKSQLNVIVCAAGLRKGKYGEQSY